MIKKIISGGQTGADRAALDAAIALGIPHGGWIPKGRKTEKGILPDRYHLQEMPTASYPKRTEKNILDSDATLIINHGNLTGGSSLTRKFAKQHGKPWLHINLDKLSVQDAIKTLGAWLERHEVKVLNVAGSRASKDPEIYDATIKILESILEQP